MAEAALVAAQPVSHSASHQTHLSHVNVCACGPARTSSHSRSLKTSCYTATQLTSCISLQGCGAEGGPCCISTSSNGGPQASCSSGLSCMPPSSGWGSKAQLEALSGGFAAAVGDPAVMGTCRKFTVNDCGKAFMPCGKDIGELGVQQWL